MLEVAKDIAIVSQAVMDSYGKQGLDPLIGVPAVQLLSVRGEYSMCMGVLPPYWRPLVSRLPACRSHNECVRNLASGMSVMTVAKHLVIPPIVPIYSTNRKAVEMPKVSLWAEKN